MVLLAPPQQAEVERFIPLSDAARAWNIAEAHLRRLAEAGTIKAMKLPNGRIAIQERSPQTTMESLLTVAQAAERLGISPEKMQELIDDGHVKVAKLPDGLIMVPQSSLPLRKEDLPEYKKYAHLKGVTIWVNKAARDYAISSQTISQWVRSGVIRKIGVEGRKVLIDKADVAYCAEIYHKHGGQGKRLFNPDGTPYTPKRNRNILPYAI